MKFLFTYFAKMRWNMKRFLVILMVGLGLWIFAAYFHSLSLPSRVPAKVKLEDYENRIQNIQKEMATQYSEITKLLDTVKNLHKNIKTESSAKEQTQEKKDGDYQQGHVLPAPPSQPVLPVLVIACDRVTVRRCLDNLVKFRPSKEMFPIIVSQDCGHNATYQVIKSYTDKDPSIAVVKQPDLTEIKLQRKEVKFRGYYKIARHYKFALNHIFKTLGHEAVIIVEDDLDISPDFFEYFQGTYPLLSQDPSIWCISAWNDNGKKEVIDLDSPSLLHRTDFFPGLGWILRADSWAELEPNWPLAFFDDWLRDPVVTRGRSCIRPEISRTYSFGKIGVSKGLFFDNHLRHMQLNMQFVEFTKLNLTHLLKINYDDELNNAIQNAELMSADKVMSLPPPAVEGERVKVFYHDAKTFQRAAKRLGLMDDFRSGIPRTAYQGTVTCFVGGCRVYLVPDFIWTRYDPTWG